MPGAYPPGVREAVALDLAAGQSVAAAGRKHGVAERTIRRWLTGPKFAARCDALRMAMIEQATAILAAGAASAAVQLRVLSAESESETIKLSASRAILDHMLSLDTYTRLDRQQKDIKARLDRLEAEKESKHEYVNPYIYSGHRPPPNPPFNDRD